jgi:hypothetical protein
MISRWFGKHHQYWCLGLVVVLQVELVLKAVVLLTL